MSNYNKMSNSVLLKCRFEKLYNRLKKDGYPAMDSMDRLKEVVDFYIKEANPKNINGMIKELDVMTREMLSRKVLEEIKQECEQELNEKNT